MKLIGSVTSPYTRKVRIVLAEKRIDYEFQLENVSDPANRVSEFNPLGKVPVLVLDDGTTVFDSPVIVEYLDSVTPVGRLIPEPSRQRIQVKRWEALGDGVMDAAVLVMAEHRRPEERRSPEWILRQRGKIDRALLAMSQDLGDKTWCTGESFNLADIVAGCALFYLEFRFPDIDWRAQYANLGRLAEKLGKRKSFQDSVPVA
jgi:glutathione S-transferase